MAKEKEPERIVMTPDEVKAIYKRIEDFELTREDAKLFGKSLHFMFWFQDKLARVTTTLNKLKKMVFGSTTEKRSSSQSRGKGRGNASNDANVPVEQKPTAAGTADSSLAPNGQQDMLATTRDISGKKPVKGHGRMGANAYNPDETIIVPHQLLKSGDPCPLACGGRLYELDPGIVIRVQGQSCAHVVQYEFGKLRCALCNAVFTAAAPPGFSPQKYDALFKANLVVQKYFMAAPFFRQERYHKLLGFRLPDSTQWDMVESVADCAYPILNVLEQMAANGTNINNDDTNVKILDIIRANKLDPDKKRKGMFTTCIFAQSGDYKICLYYSGVKHAGENLSRILEKRDKDLPPIIQMCDALSANVPAALKTILCNCLTHGRRKFTDIESFFPEECGHVIEQLAHVYKHDADAKEQGMSADERLAHHKKHSAPIMEALGIWMQAQFDERKTEPNSTLGSAIRYMQNHWAELTKFLSVSGAHIDNNVVERALKLAIRTRKNAMFHKSVHGAFIASLFLSLIATCELAGKNPVHYLVALQKHKSDVFKHPDLWLPWNYESTLLGLRKAA